MYSILPRLQTIRFQKARNFTTMQTKTENTQTNQVIAHELNGDLRMFTIVEMKRTEVNEQTKEQTEESTFSIAIGNQLVSEPFKSKRDAINYVKAKPYRIIMAVVMKAIDYKLTQHETK